MALSQTKVRGILFDLWGTLVYNVPHLGRAEYEALSRRIGQPTDEIWHRWSALSTEALRGEIKSGEERARRILTELGAPLDMAGPMADFEYQNRSGEVHFFPGVPEMLAELQRRGYQTCLISNCNYLTPPVVERLKIPEMLNAVILSCQVGLIKPEVAIYELGAQKLKLNTEDCLFVGDGGDSELDGATAAGCQVALVAQERGHAFRFPTKEYPYDIRLTHITDLLSYLKESAANSTAA